MVAKDEPPARSDRRSARSLWACAALYLAVLLVGITLPLRLDRHSPSLTTNLAFMYGRDLVGIACYLVLVLLLCVCWCWALSLVRAASARALPMVVAGTALFGAALLAAHPIYSFDVFHYAATARVQFAHGENPHITPPARYPDDRVASLSDWRNLPSPYGPAWSWLSAVPYALSGGLHDPVAALLGFKLLAVASVVITTWLVGCAAERLRPGAGTLTAAAFGWNPLVVLHLMGDAHNEAVMLAPLAGALLALTYGRFSTALVLIALATLVKPPAAFAGLLLVVMLIRHRRWSTLAPAALMSVLLAVVLWLPLWNGPVTLGAAFDEGRYFTSTPAALALLLIEPASRDAWNPWVGAALRLALVTSAVALGWRASQQPTDLLRRLALLYLVAVVPLSGWYQPWYATWALLPLALPVTGMVGRYAGFGLTLGGLLVVVAPGFLAGALERNGGTDTLINVLATLFAHGPVALALVLFAIRRAREEAPRDATPELNAHERDRAGASISGQGRAR